MLSYVNVKTWGRDCITSFPVEKILKNWIRFKKIKGQEYSTIFPNTWDNGRKIIAEGRDWKFD